MAQSLNFPSEFPYELDSFGSNSGFNSPVDSAVSSTDASTSADDDFFLGLAQQLAWTSLHESHKSVSPCSNPNKTQSKCVGNGSPQSILSGFDSWIRPEYSSSLLKSSPMAVLKAENDARLKMSGEINSYHNRDHLISGCMGVRSSIPVKSTNGFDYGLLSNQNCSRNLDQMQRVREDLVLQILSASSWRRQDPPHRKPENHNRERNIAPTARCGGCTGGASHSPYLPPPLSHQPPPISTAVRGVHPGRSGVKRASSGTGVFLPRRHVNPSDCRQKRGISANRFAEEIMNSNQAPLNYYQSSSFDSISTPRINPLIPTSRSFRAEVAINQELLLPQDWTY